MQTERRRRGRAQAAAWLLWLVVLALECWGGWAQAVGKSSSSRVAHASVPQLAVSHATLPENASLA